MHTNFTDKKKKKIRVIRNIRVQNSYTGADNDQNT